MLLMSNIYVLHAMAAIPHLKSEYTSVAHPVRARVTYFEKKMLFTKCEKSQMYLNSFKLEI